MPDYHSQMFYLGNFADIDIDESDFTAEGAGAILGTYSKPPLITLTLYDGTGDGLIFDNDMGAGALEAVDFNTGGGVQASHIDSTVVYNIRVTLGDGSTSDILATAIQMVTGDVFLTDYINGGTLDNINIQSIELLSVSDAVFSSFAADSSADNVSVVCFLEGTRVATPKGPCAIEHLKPGEWILTRDHGARPLVAKVSRNVPPNPEAQPIRIAANGLAPGVPTHTLWLSPQHRVLASGPVVERMFHVPEVFVAAKALLPLPGVSQVRVAAGQRYWHILCAEHEIIFAEGCPTETLFSGQQALRSVNSGRAGAFAAFRMSNHAAQLARPVPRFRRQANLITRCAANNHAICAAVFS